MHFIRDAVIEEIRHVAPDKLQRREAADAPIIGLPTPIVLTALTRQMFQAAIATGHGDEDICSTIKVLEGLTGVEVKA